MKSENAFSGNQITTTMPIRKQDEKLRSYINNALKARYNKSRITGKTKRDWFQGERSSGAEELV